MGLVHQYDHPIYRKKKKVREKMVLTTLQTDLLRWNTTWISGHGIPHHQNFVKHLKSLLPFCPSSMQCCLMHMHCMLQ